MAQILLPANVRENNYKEVISILKKIEDIRFLSYQELALKRVVIQILEYTRRENVSYRKQRGEVKASIEWDVNAGYFSMCFAS